jgi:hypothetical protein
MSHSRVSGRTSPPPKPLPPCCMVIDMDAFAAIGAWKADETARIIARTRKRNIAEMEGRSLGKIEVGMR